MVAEVEGVLLGGTGVPMARKWFWMDSRIERSSEPAIRQLEHRLREPGEELVAQEAALFEVAVHPSPITGLPELHQLVEAIYQRGRGAVGGRLTETLAAAAIPRLEAHLAAARRRRFLSVVIVLHRPTLATAGQNVQAPREVRIRQVAGEGVEDAGPAGSRL